MPLAQNYVDDVSLVESRVNCPTTESNLQQRFLMNINVS